MNLEIRVRRIHIAYLDKELKVLLRSTGSHKYELYTSSANDGQQFSRLITRHPALIYESLGKHLTLDFYMLIKPEGWLDVPDEVNWFAVQEAVKLNTDLSTVIENTLKSLREDLNFQPIEYYLLPEKFTIPELQRLYELILNKNLDRSNFSRKITILKFLQSEGLKKTGCMYRSPMLYTFNNNYFKKSEEGLFKEF